MAMRSTDNGNRDYDSMGGLGGVLRGTQGGPGTSFEAMGQVGVTKV